MAEAIENVIDAWLITNFTDEIGSGSAYASSKLATVQTAILRSPKDWEGWTFPALGMSNRFVYRSMVLHPSTLDKTIVYLLTFVTYGTESAAIQESRTLLARAEMALAAIKTNLSGIVNDYGETANELIYYKSAKAPEAGASRLRKYIDPAVKDRWFVAQDISVVFRTTTGA